MDALAWSAKIAAALAVGALMAALGRALAGTSRTARIATILAAMAAAALPLLLAPRTGGALVAATLALLLHAARWRPWIALLPAASAAWLAPALGIPLLALPLLRGVRATTLAPAALAATLAVALQGALALPPRPLLLGTLVLCGAGFAGIHAFEPRWRQGRALATAAIALGAAGPALAILAVLASTTRLPAAGVLPGAMLVLAAAAIAGLALYLASLGAVILLSTQSAARGLLLAMGAAAIVGILLLGLPAALLLLPPFALAAGLGATSLLPRVRAGHPGAIEPERRII